MEIDSKPESMDKLDRRLIQLKIEREAMNKEEFAFAVEQYNKAIETCKAVLMMAENKFQAKTGTNFTDPKVGMEFVWIQSAKIWVSKYETTNEEYRKFKPTHDSKKANSVPENRPGQSTGRVTSRSTCQRVAPRS